MGSISCCFESDFAFKIKASLSVSDIAASCLCACALPCDAFASCIKPPADPTTENIERWSLHGPGATSVFFC